MLNVSLKTLKCIKESSELGSDEPYVLVAAVDLTSTAEVSGFPVPIPSFDVVLYGSFSNVDSGDTRTIGEDKPSFWDLQGDPSDINSPDDVIFIAALMERDNGDPETLRGIVKGIIASSVFGSISLGRAAMVNKLLADINSAIGTPTGAPNFDDKIARPQEIRFSQSEIDFSKNLLGVRKKLNFSSLEGIYSLTFEVRNPNALEGRSRGFTIQQVSNGRFVDAHQNSDNDFSVVTRPRQGNDTQRWLFDQVGGVYRIKHKETGRFLDAHEEVNDSSAVTRNRQDNDTQLWVISPDDKNKATIQQLSSTRFLDAHESGNDFSAVTRSRQNNNSQKWTIEPNSSGDYILEQRSTKRILDAKNSGDRSVVTRKFQALADAKKALQDHVSRLAIGNAQHHETPNFVKKVLKARDNADASRLWELEQVGAVYTIKQKSSGRFVDAHETSNDFSIVTRTKQNNDTQKWVVLPNSNGRNYTIQQLVNARFWDAHENTNDSSVVTRTAQKNSTQLWEISAS